MKCSMLKFGVCVLLFFSLCFSAPGYVKECKGSIERFIQMIQAYCVYPEDHMVEMLYHSVPDSLDMTPAEKVKLGAYLFSSRFGEDIESGRRYAIKTALKILEANRLEKDEDVRRRLDGVLLFHLGNLLRLKPQVCLEMIRELWPEKHKVELLKTLTFLPQDFWLRQVTFPAFCSIKPLNVICYYELLERKRKLAGVFDHEEIKNEIIKGLDERLKELGYLDAGEGMSRIVEHDDAAEKIIDMTARLSRFISYYKKVEEARPELLPENYQQLKNAELQFRLQDSLASFILGEAALGNRRAAEVIIRGEVAYHLGDWLDILGSLTKKAPEYFLELLSTWQKAEGVTYKPHVVDEFCGLVIKDILRQQSVPYEEIDGLSMKVELLPIIVEMNKRIRALKGVGVTRYPETKETCLSELEVAVGEAKKKLFNRKPLLSSEEIEIRGEGEGYLYNPPGKIKYIIDCFVKKPDDKNANKLIDSLIEYSSLNKDEDIGLLLIVPQVKAIAGGLPAKRYLLLEKIALSGNKKAIQFLLNTYINSSGVIKEIVRGTLANIIDRYPSLFLDVVSEDDSLEAETVGEIVRYVDDIRTDLVSEDRIEILNKRKGALLKLRSGKHSDFIKLILSRLGLHN